MGGERDMFPYKIHHATSQTPRNHANKLDPKFLEELKPNNSPMSFVPNDSKSCKHENIFFFQM